MRKDIPILSLVILVSISFLIISFFIGLLSGIFDLPDTITMSFGMDVIEGVIYISLLYYIMKKLFDENIFDLFNNNWRVSKILLIGTISIFFVLVIEYFTDPIAKTLPHFKIFDEIYLEMLQLPKNYYELVIQVTSVTIITAIVEELFFRGFLYKTLRKKYNVSISVLILTAIFILFHLNPQILIIVANIILCLSFEYSKSLSLPIFIHTGINAATLFVVLSDKIKS